MESLSRLHRALVLLSLQPFEYADHRVLSKSSDLTRQKKYDDQHIQRVEEIEALALGEVEKGFPLLVSHSVVALWSALEAAIVAFCADWLVSHPECLQLESVARIRLPVAAFANADNKATMEAVVDEISQRIDAAMKPGIGRFQSLLENIGIGFGVDADLRKCLFEMSKARNLIAHKSVRVDRKFASECPWLKLQESDPFVISLDPYSRYCAAAREYVAQLVLSIEAYETNQPEIKA